MDDSAIVQLYWDRDKMAIDETSKKYGRYCETIANNILGNREDAEECVNDTYLNAWNSIPPQKPQMLAAYLGKITRNLSFNLYKKNRAKKRGGSHVTLILDELEEVISNSESLDERYQRKELIDAINSFLKTVPISKRKLFVCRYWYGDDVKDIATRFRISESNVSVSLNRLRKKLHNYLLERGFEL
ncbi:MAG: sigma-70 family RNA polymerase sigma factor [Lachnospiraceae bacterium]|nr:sigma-70 family RNA polymerase sigma factor [Lachnospiraceae bacterium]